MSDEQPLLTIAIPTYNRASFLRELLSDIFSQIVAEHRVELIVSDNASTDETPEVVAKVMQQGLKVRYLRNEMNIGPDANFLQCFECAQGRYAWIFGDDDSLAPGGLKKVLNILDSETNYDLVSLKPHSFRAKHWWNHRRAEKAKLQRFTSNPIEFAHLVNAHGDFIFISSMIINRDRVINHLPASRVDMVGSQVLQLAWVFTALRSMKHGMFVEDRLLLAGRDDHRGNFSAAKVFVVNYLKAIDLWIGDEVALKNALVDDLIVFWFKNWVSLRRHSGKISTADSRKIVSVLSSKGAQYWIFVVPLVRLPVYMAFVWNHLLELVRRYIQWKHEVRMGADG